MKNKILLWTSQRHNQRMRHYSCLVCKYEWESHIRFWKAKCPACQEAEASKQVIKDVKKVEQLKLELVNQGVPQ